MGAPAAAEALAQSSAGTQSLMSGGSLLEMGNIGLGGINITTGGLLTGVGVSQAALAALGGAGPSYGATPANLGYNSAFASMVIAELGYLGGVFGAQALLGLGTNALLANSGRNFLNATYFGL